MLLILIGTLILLSNMDIVQWRSGPDLGWSLLPFFLILVGIEKIFTRSKLQFISYATSIVLVAGGVLLAVDTDLTRADYDFGETREVVFDPEEPVTLLQAEIRIDDGNLTVSHPCEELLVGEFPEFTPSPRFKEVIKDSIASVTLSSRSRGFYGGIVRIETDEPDDWNLSFSRTVPLDLTCYGDDSHIYLNLDSIPCRTLKVVADDARITVRVGSLEPNVDISVEGEDSKLYLYVPPESGLRVDGPYVEDCIRGLELTDQDGVFFSPGFDSAACKINVTLESDFRSCNLGYYGDKP